MSWGATVAPEVIVHYYKMQLFVRTDDGRTIGVYSTRHIPPRTGDRVVIQERIGLLGTRAYVELSDN